MTTDEKIHRLRLALIGLLVFQNEFIEAYGSAVSADEKAWLNRGWARLKEAEQALKDTE